jgi:hypothetical protein
VQAAAKALVAPSQGSTPDGGQPQDFNSERQDRRDKAKTDEAADDTGGDSVERERQE